MQLLHRYPSTVGALDSYYVIIQSVHLGIGPHLPTVVRMNEGTVRR